MLGVDAATRASLGAHSNALDVLGIQIHIDHAGSGLAAIVAARAHAVVAVGAQLVFPVVFVAVVEAFLTRALVSLSFAVLAVPFAHQQVTLAW